MSHRRTIAVYPPPVDPRVSRLFQCLAAAFEVDFAPVDSLEALSHDAVLLLADDTGALLRELESFPAVFSAPAPAPDSPFLSGNTRFSSAEILAVSLRDQTLEHKLATRLCPEDIAGFTELARMDETTVWSRSPDRLHYRSNIPVGGLAGDEDLIDALHEYAFISVLPVVDFVRALCHANAWEQPRLRALLIIDDPNLHSVRYGHIPYARFAEKARQVGFHACMATVPFDGWYLNAGAVNLFRTHADVLSLAVHGNDHEFNELARPISVAGARSIMAQALARVAAMEKRSGLQVARVMIPPHGLCSDPFVEAMVKAGFHGATTTRDAIWAYNVHFERLPGSGTGPAEIVDGLPFAHRFRFTSARWSHRIAISAYLGHPLIAHGHHQDFAKGLDAFDTVARRLNQLGAKWVDATGMFASNFETRREGDVLRVRPFSRHVIVPVENGSSQVQVDLGGLAARHGAVLKVSESGSAETRVVPSGTQVSIPISKPGRLAIAIETPEQETPPTRRTPLMSVARRILSECRDRWVGLRGHSRN